MNTQRESKKFVICAMEKCNCSREQVKAYVTWKLKQNIMSISSFNKFGEISNA